MRYNVLKFIEIVEFVVRANFVRAQRAHLLLNQANFLYSIISSMYKQLCIISIPET